MLFRVGTGGRGALKKLKLYKNLQMEQGKKIKLNRKDGEIS